ncbi:MAG: T9SS type A sorting domain-containing protein [Bacteroidales bacterium]|nr:T9SS type A sorting domain-containing protein [Bacteroidales bacterium]
MTNSDIAEESYYVVICCGIQDAQQQVSIYPNPTTSDVTLDLSGLNARTVELFSMNGQLLNTVVPTEETMMMSLSQYAAGIYFVRIHTDKGITTQKIVKK